MRSLTPVQAAVAVAIGGSILVTVIPAFVKNLHASRLAEALEGLNRIAARATAIAAGQAPESAYPESVGLTPSRVPRGERVVDPPGTWRHPTWVRLDFSMQDVPHAFSFAFESQNAAPPGAAPSQVPTDAPRGRARFTARAHGDLDGDGSLSTFQISGEMREGGEPTTLPIVIYREVE